jgi:hypothetical protein
MKFIKMINKKKEGLVLVLLICLFCSFQKRNLSDDGWEVLFDGKNTEKW